MHYIPLLAWVALWAWLLVDCLRRDRFPPIFGHGHGNRVAWLVALALFDPLLTLCYFFMVKLGLGGASRWIRWGVAVAAALVILGWIDASIGTTPTTMSRGPNGDWPGRGRLLDISATVNLHRSRSSFSSTFTPSRGALLPVRDVEVLMSDDGAVTAGLAQLITAELAALPFVQRIDIRTRGETRAGGRAPDLRIRVSGAPPDSLTGCRGRCRARRAGAAAL